MVIWTNSKITSNPVPYCAESSGCAYYEMLIIHGLTKEYGLEQKQLSEKLNCEYISKFLEVDKLKY